MNTVLDLPDDLFEEVEARAALRHQNLQETVTDLLRSALAYPSVSPAQVEVTEEMLRRRQEMTDKFVSGEWGLEFASYERDQEADRTRDRARLDVWSE